MIVYRLTNHLSLDGKGAAKQYNNRWNSFGTRILYTAGSIAVAKGEISRRVPLNLLPKDFRILTLELPDNSLSEIDRLPPGWDVTPAGRLTKEIGDDFIKEGTYLTLQVPSIYDKSSFNFLINPVHKLMAQVRIVKQEELYL